MKKIVFAQPKLGKREWHRVRAVLKSGWLTSGTVSAQLEREFMQASNARYACAVSSATAGLHLALEACGFKEGDLLCVSPYTFCASATVALQMNMEICFVDITADGYTIDCHLLEKALINARATRVNNTRIAIMPVHVGGALCDMDTICKLAKKYACTIIEDAAHGQPLCGEGGEIARRGDCAIFSLYATKPITAAEGGIVITDNKQVAEKIKTLRNHGMTKSLWERDHDTAVRAKWAYDIVQRGYKYNLSDIHAAIGVAQLRRAQKNWLARKKIAEYYLAQLSGTEWLTLPKRQNSAWHLFMITIDQKKLTCTREQFLDRLAQQNILCSVHYLPLHMTTLYATLFSYNPKDFPRACARYQSEISIPLYAGLTMRNARYVARTVLNIGNTAQR